MLFSLIFDFYLNFSFIVNLYFQEKVKNKTDKLNQAPPKLEIEQPVQVQTRSQLTRPYDKLRKYRELSQQHRAKMAQMKNSYRQGNPLYI